MSMGNRSRWLLALAEALCFELGEDAWDDIGDPEKQIWYEHAEQVLPRWQSNRAQMARQERKAKA